MKGSKYIISIKINDHMIFLNEKKEKNVDKWVNTYKRNNTAEEIKIYTKKLKNNTYELIYHDHRRKIGF